MMTAEKTKTPFAVRLLQARTHAGLSQKALAELAGMAQSTYGKLEQEGHGSSYVAEIAQACGVSVMWLANGSGCMLDSAMRPSANYVIPDPLADTRAVFGKEITEMLGQFKERAHLTVAFARIIGVLDSYQAELLSMGQPQDVHAPSVERRRQVGVAPNQRPVPHQ